MSGATAATFCATLVDEWIRLGVRHGVVCPGSRSTPMALALAGNGVITLHVHHDERSAGFLAMGLAIATGGPAIVLTTSGTAAVELHPAMVEAHHSHIPLLAVTADRPPELRGLGAPQTIDQRELFGVAASAFFDVAPPLEADRRRWRDIAAAAYIAATADVPGPVHVNLGFAEPLVGTAGELPPRRSAKAAEPSSRDRSEGRLDTLAALVGSVRGVIVAGVRTVRGAAASGEADRAAIFELAELTGWPVLADHLSGVRTPHPMVVGTFDALLRDSATARRLRPEAVLRVGGLLASRVTNEWLAASGARQIGLDRWGSCPDPDRTLESTVRVEIADACSRLCSLVAADPSWRADDEARRAWRGQWAEAESVARGAIAPLLAGEPAVASAVLEAIPQGSVLVVSSSMPVRDLEWYGPHREGVRVVANRGANGIDGVVSTAVGVAASGTPTACLVGDIAFLHDSNALIGLAARRLDLLIVVVDNDGGGIFSFLPQSQLLETTRFEQLFGTPHGSDLAALAGAHGVPVERVGDLTELATALCDWSATRGTRVVIVTSDRAGNVEVHRRLNEAVAKAVGLRSVGSEPHDVA